MKLTKRMHLTCSQSDDKYETRYSTCDGMGKVYAFHQSFALMWKHKKGSKRPEGFFHSPYGDIKVEVTWNWVERLGWYAPKIEFRPHRLATKIVAKVANALSEIKNDRDVNPDMLIDELAAIVVALADDKEGCYADYRALRVPGEPAMMTIARHAL